MWAISDIKSTAERQRYFDESWLQEFNVMILRQVGSLHDVQKEPQRTESCGTLYGIGTQSDCLIRFHRREDVVVHQDIKTQVVLYYSVIFYPVIDTTLYNMNVYIVYIQ